MPSTPSMEAVTRYNLVHSSFPFKEGACNDHRAPWAAGTGAPGSSRPNSAILVMPLNIPDPHLQSTLCKIRQRILASSDGVHYAQAHLRVILINAWSSNVTVPTKKARHLPKKWASLRIFLEETFHTVDWCAQEGFHAKASWAHGDHEETRCIRAIGS